VLLYHDRNRLRISAIPSEANWATANNTVTITSAEDKNLLRDLQALEEAIPCAERRKVGPEGETFKSRNSYSFAIDTWPLTAGSWNGAFGSCLYCAIPDVYPLLKRIYYSLKEFLIRSTRMRLSLKVLRFLRGWTKRPAQLLPGLLFRHIPRHAAGAWAFWFGCFAAFYLD